MKKLLIATAALAMVAGTVQAQSSVTVYGMVGFEIGQDDVENGAKNTVTGSQSSDKATQLGTPVLGFRGAEDLGGGLKAEFNLEGSLNANNGQTGTSNATTTSNLSESSLFDRQAWVGVSGGFGSIRMGRQNNALKDIDGLGETGANMFDNDGAGTLQQRDARTIKYISPSFNGVTATISNSTDVGPLNAGGGLEVTAYNLTYKNGPFTVAYGNAERKETNGKTTDETVIGGSYNAGFATFDASYQMVEQNTTATTAGTYRGDVDTMQFGVHIPVGKQLAVKVNYTDLEYKADATKDTTYVGAMAVYSLSKRTSVYAGYLSESGNDGADLNTAMVGVNHSF
jgi:predicted porin